MGKRILTLDDLVQFCSKTNLVTFDAKDSGYSLCVQMPFEDASVVENTDSMLFAKIKAFHIGKNRNGSAVTEDAAKNALPTIKYKPLLANFTDVNGETDFTSHDFEITKDENGEEHVTYLEKQVGCFTADEPEIIHDDEYDKDYV